MQTDLNEIFSHFDIETQLSPYGNGHINDTYVTSGKPRYILQRINTSIFKDPAGLMQNIKLVTAHLRKKILEENGDPSRETLVVIPTVDEQLFYKAPDAKCYRVYEFVEDTITLEKPETKAQLYAVGKSFGKFQRQLADFPADSLSETIPDFHNTPKRVIALKEAIKKDVYGRAAYAKPEIDFALSYAEKVGVIHAGIENHTIPLRVTHNDTKINNVLLDAETQLGVCVIDLDTVMPGSLLYDFGDALRTGAASAAEDETDLSKMYLDLRFFKAFSEGFLEETLHSMTESEFDLLADSVLIMTYECGIRFLTDFLSGDTYFKIHRPDHNYDRARAQFKLVADIAAKLPEMKRILKNLKDKEN